MNISEAEMEKVALKKKVKFKVRPELAMTILSPIALLLVWWGLSLMVGEKYSSISSNYCDNDDLIITGWLRRS